MAESLKDATGWFEIVYAGAGGNADRVPWAVKQARPIFEEWLRKHELQGRGQRALVVGCGLGDDAEELARRGFAVTAFDVAPSAIAWARQRFPDSVVDYQVADLFQPPADWVGAFDFVLEIFTVQALPIMLREQSMEAIARFVAPGGELLVICIATDEAHQRSGPPWPLTREEIDYFLSQDLEEVEFEECDRQDRSSVCKFRAHYRRPVG